MKFVRNQCKLCDEKTRDMRVAVCQRELAMQREAEWRKEFMMAAEALYAHVSGGYVSKAEVDRIIALWREQEVQG